MFNDIVPQESPAEMPQPIGRIRFLDVRLNMHIEANVFDGFVEFGRAYLTIQPVAQELGKGKWLAIDLDDTAFPVNVEDMRDIVQVQA